MLDQTKESLPAYMGIDLGGTNIYTVSFDEDYTVIFEKKIDTDAKEGYLPVIEKLATLIQESIASATEKNYRIAGVGLGVPGIVSVKDQTIIQAPNLGWKMVKPLETLRTLIPADMPLIMENDVNCGLAGELVRYRATPLVSVAIFCGTGIGGAIALNGKLITGEHGGAGEVGHLKVEKGGDRCACGQRGCLEAYIGKWALNRKISDRLNSEKPTLLKDIIKYDLKKGPVHSSSLKKAYRAGDNFTVDLMENYYCNYLAVGISQVIHLLDPTLIILGGGIMESLGMELLPTIEKRVQENSIQENCRIRLAELGDLAGALGAASLARPV